MEAEVQRHEFSHGGDVIVRESQLHHPFARDSGTDRVVVVKRGALAGLKPARARLTDIVKQRRETHQPKIKRGTFARLLIERPNVLDHRDRV